MRRDRLSRAILDDPNRYRRPDNQALSPGRRLQCSTWGPWTPAAANGASRAPVPPGTPPPGRGRGMPAGHPRRLLPGI